MPSRKELARNNIRAGIFVSIALLLLVGVVLTLTGALEPLFSSFRSYAVVFPVEQGVGYLSPGSDVRLGGMDFGRVTAVDLDPDDPARRIRIEFEIDDRVELFADATLLIKSQLIGSESWIEIPGVGSADAGPPAGGVLSGTTTPGVLSALLGAQNAARADTIVRNTETFTDFLAEVRGEYERRVAPTLENAEAASADIRAVTEDLRGARWPAWAATIGDVMEWADRATEQIDGTLSEGRELLVGARAAVDDNRPQLDAIVDNIDSGSADVAAVTRRVRDETVDRVHDVLAKGGTALDDATRVIGALRDDYQGWAPRFGEMVANATLASQELKFATIEVRRNPWKLLYRPTTRELENELLYEAARSFALAATDLRATSETVSRILQTHAGELGASEAAMQRIERDLERSLENYTRAQQELLDVLVD